MATCYHCGRAGADYRRTVNTGTSTTYHSGKRGGSTSTRVNSGLRTLCEECAFNVDRKSVRGTIVFLWILAVILVCLIIYLKF